MGIREQLGRALLGPEIQNLQESFGLLRNAYLDGPWRVPPDELVRQLGEYDSAVLHDLVTQLNWDVIGGMVDQLSEDRERSRAVSEARRLYRYDVLTEWAVQTWTNYGFGENIEITPVDEAAQETWEEFWTAERNADVLAPDELHQLSETVLIDGDLFLACYVSTLDGETTVRIIDSTEVTEILTDPDDSASRLFYKRTWTPAGSTSRTMYYPDWRAYFSGELDEGREGGTLADAVLPRDAIRADQQNDSTIALILHIAHNRKGSIRGWPITLTAASWSRTHKQFREDRASVARAMAMYIQKIKVKGGSRAVDAVRSRLQSTLTQTNYLDTNPPAAAGATWLENQAASLERLPMSTGASDAKIDGESLHMMACLGLGLFPHYAGAGDAYKLATATAMERPLEMQWSRYQLFWSAQFRKLVKVVLLAAERYGNQTFETYEAEVSTDRLVEVDLVSLSTSLTGLYRDALAPYLEMGVMPHEVTQEILAATWRIVLQAIGVEDAADITSDEAFGIGEEAEAVAVPVGLTESHVAQEIERRCPLNGCQGTTALEYPDHEGLLVCVTCARTFDPEME